MLSLLLTPVFALLTTSTLLKREFPHLIIPVNSDSPDKNFGTQYSAEVTNSIYTEISFDVPSNTATTCTLSFTLSTDPKWGAPWQLWGEPPFIFNVSSLPTQINEHKDTWNHRPAPIEPVATIEVAHDGSTTVEGVGGSSLSFPCAKGQVAQFLLHVEGEREFGITWFELDVPLHGITYDMIV